jgi:GNAT superfamily N-acetyltransferase
MRLKDYIKEDEQRMVQFVRKFYATGYPNPIGRGVVFGLSAKEGEDAMVKVELEPKVDSVHLKEIITLEDMGKRGYGDYVMKQLTSLADKMDIRLTLFSVPLQHQGVKIPKSKLITFYKRHGFKTKSGDYMERLPK